MVKVVKKGKRNGKQRIIIEFSNTFKKWLSIPLNKSEIIILALKQCKNVDEVNYILKQYDIPRIKEKESEEITLESHIKSVLSIKSLIPSMELDDLYQELFLKGLEVLRSTNKNFKNNSQKWAYVKQALINHLKDLKKQEYETCITEINSEDNPGSVFDYLLATNNVANFEIPTVKFPNPEKVVIQKDFVEKILKWASRKSPIIKEFFDEYFNPSEDIEQEIEKSNSKSTWKNREWSPLYCAKLMSKTGKWKYKDGRDKWLKIRKEIIKDFRLAV